ncbi:flagellar hook assembly protein FlgD [Limimaricola pyoseonensis]|uniref:Basal-body rod modification protein FlgD n=1 Tax=Limimaricola pyoseonensis TaxID=521013 RepID=A0A1G7KAC0_9RHOB|nr:flagellar hook assembly protein FlgD [Limimaricola pyoseonensis]SDF34183.1 flagellar basal-body rod modification protein FlgD [Limimaricola pyoseonensis]
MDSLTPTSGAAAAASKSAAAESRDKLGADYQSFLKLLIAQVSNQDPLEPMDSTTFVSQLAQLTQVEQSITTNETLEKIEAQLAAGSARADVALIGREVLAPTDQIRLADGEAAFAYRLNGEARSAAALIRDPDGTLLRRIDDLPTGPGQRHDVVWDGLDSEGLPVPPGRFRVEIEALDAEEEAVLFTTYAPSTVERIAFRDGAPVLRLENQDEIAAGSILELR